MKTNLLLDAVIRLVKHIETKWKPEIDHHSPETPFLIVGTKSDLRKDNKLKASLAAKGKPLKPRKQAEAEARALGALKYMECSALIFDGLDDVFDEAIRVALRRKNNRRTSLAAKAKRVRKGGKSGCIIV
mmetsp:Transcript_19195/g.35518  ORF Transcript_19195/g.35518 Transcript_19195/m.35518 type:complete len:130 (-) Transcript_19195:140-529(-)